MDSKKLLGIAAAVVAVVIAIVVLNHPSHPAGAVTGETNYDNLGLIGLKLGPTCNNSFGSSGCQKLQQIRFASCQILAYSNTIAASSTGQVDCGSNGTVGGTLTGVQAGDLVFAEATTTISGGTSVQGALTLIAANASSTNGYVTLIFDNETGGIFTWGAIASTSFKYLDLR